MYKRGQFWNSEQVGSSVTPIKKFKYNIMPTSIKLLIYNNSVQVIKKEDLHERLTNVSEAKEFYRIQRLTSLCLPQWKSFLGQATT